MVKCGRVEAPRGVGGGAHDGGEVAGEGLCCAWVGDDVHVMDCDGFDLVVAVAVCGVGVVESGVDITFID